MRDGYGVNLVWYVMLLVAIATSSSDLPGGVRLAKARCMSLWVERLVVTGGNLSVVIDLSLGVAPVVSSLRSAGVLPILAMCLATAVGVALVIVWMHRCKLELSCTLGSSVGGAKAVALCIAVLLWIIRTVCLLARQLSA